MSDPRAGSSLGPVDLHLIGEGRHRALWEALGAHVDPHGCWFHVWAPNARSVGVAGDWNGWDASAAPMTPLQHSGVWEIHIAGVGAGAPYKYGIVGADGRFTLRADPLARAAEVPPANASVVMGPSSHRWGDDDWIERRSHEDTVNRPLRIYEVHLGSWRPGLGYREAAHQLGDYVSDLGFTHVELLPLAEHPYAPSWGYQVTGYYAPTARFGTPDDFRHLVDHLHGRGIGVIMDWVPAHFPRDAWALARFDGTALYEHEDPRQGAHPDWGTLVFNYGRDEVRGFLIANALYWFREFHIDGLRVDAVASMLYLDYSREPGGWVANQFGGRENLEAIEFLKQLNTVVFAEHPGVMMVAEESTSWPMVSRPVDSGGLGFSHKWNMGWMHDTLDYLSNDPIHRKWHHHELTFGLLYAYTENFVLPFSHDEVVHGKRSLLGKMPGDEWQKFANLRALFGWMYAYPGGKLVFAGGEIGQWGEWSDRDGIDWSALAGERHRGVQELVRAMSACHRAHPALYERDHHPAGFRWLDADDTVNSTYCFLRFSTHGTDVVACLANFTPVPREGYRVGLPWAGEWQVLLDTNAVYFGGTGYGGTRSVEAGASPYQGQPASAVLTLPPLAVVWLGPA